MAHTLKASLPCLPLPLHQSLLFPLIFAKEHLSLALLALPVTPTLSIPTTINEIFYTPIFITNYTKISYISFSLSFVQLYCNRNIIFRLPFISVILPSAFSLSAPSSHYNFNFIITNPIYSNNIYSILSQINRTALSVQSHPPPKPPIIFKFL